MHSHKLFEDVHESAYTVLKEHSSTLPDSLDVTAARAKADCYEGYLELGNALVRQFRYHEAIEAFTLAVNEKPEELRPLRLRAARYLTTLQLVNAAADFKKCLELGGEELDVKYRLGLCAYYSADYVLAMDYFEQCEPIAEDSMKIAAIYWHSIAAFRCGEAPKLLDKYHVGMNVGHHIGYEKCSGVYSGAYLFENILRETEEIESDLDYAILAYGLAEYMLCTGNKEQGMELLRKIIKREGFWPCFAYLAAWNDVYNKNTEVTNV